MTQSEALAKILESYTEEELRHTKDEPNTIVDDAGSRIAAVTTLYSGPNHTARITRRKVKRAFHEAGHGKPAADALANAKRVLGLAEAA
jgi:hypothetical protein